MRSDIAQLAERLIPRPGNTTETIFKNGNTDDIIKVILLADKQAARFTKKIAPYFKGATNLETARNIWNFLKQNITYKDDGFRAQNIQSPAHLFFSRSGDCKSYSVFTASILQNLGIPYSYKFVSFTPSGNVTHVYIVINPESNHQIIIDAVWTGNFNTEKNYSFHKLYTGTMAEINYVSGIGYAPKSGILQLPSAEQEWSDADVESAIIQQRAEILRDKLAGIGATRKAEQFNDALDAIYDVRRNMHNDERVGIILNGIETGAYNTSAEFGLLTSENERLQKRLAIAKIRDAQQYAGMKQNKLAELDAHIQKATTRLNELNEKLNAATNEKQRADLQARIQWHIDRINHLNQVKTNVSIAGTEGIGKFRFKKFLSKALHEATKPIKKATKAVVKVVTAPLRLAAKGILEISLPKAAPNFLYLFVTDPALIAKLPAKAKAKRDKAAKHADFIVNEIGMKRNHFMGIVRNGILKRYGRQPETIIAGLIANAKRIAGIGEAAAPGAGGDGGKAAGDATKAITTALANPEAQKEIIKFLKELIAGISKLFGHKHSQEVSEADAPTGDDWNELGTGDAKDLSNKINDQAPSDEDDGDGADGGRTKGFCGGLFD